MGCWIFEELMHILFQTACSDRQDFERPKVLYINNLPFWIEVANQGGKHLFITIGCTFIKVNGKWILLCVAEDRHRKGLPQRQKQNKQKMVQI